MHALTGRNVNELFPIAVNALHERGIKQRSQHGTTLEYPEPVSVCYTQPCERVLFNERRDANPFFQFFEALWIIAGRKDVKFLTKFNKNMVNYSDDGESYYGAYGDRVRNCEPNDGFDQIQLAIDRLKTNPEDRQVVLTIRRPDDLWYVGKDTPCFAGETILPSPEGDKSFKEVSDLFSSGRVGRWPVYAVDPDTGDVRVSWATNVWNSGVKKVVKITFDTGLVLKVTPDHILYKKKRVRDLNGKSKYSLKLDVESVQAGTLVKGDSVLATSLDWRTQKGHKWVKKNLYKNTAFNNQQKVHIAYYELEYGPIPDDHVIHHIDGDSTNNSLYNLNCIHESEHNMLHRVGANNPMKKMTPEQHEKRVVKWRESFKTRINKYGTQNFSQQDVVNHKVVSVEESEAESVYDFTVPDYHNALVGDGVVAHNCNLLVACKIREGKLNVHVFNRSNDLVWGMMGTNVVQFSMLQEYMAGKIGVEVGSYHQTTDSMHVYLNDQWDGLKDMDTVHHDPYYTKEVTPYGMFSRERMWDNDLVNLFNHFDNGGKEPEPNTRFFDSVVWPMYRAWESHKEGSQLNALAYVHTIAAEDWRKACKTWLTRRYTK